MIGCDRVGTTACVQLVGTDLGFQNVHTWGPQPELDFVSNEPIQMLCP